MSRPDHPEAWRRLHPLTPLLRSAQLLYAFVFGALAARFGGPVLPALLVATATVAAWITAAYLRYRYTVTDDALIIQHGVLFRQRRVIPRSRIQNVDLRAGMIQQLLGVVTARVETAGGQGTEAALHVVSRAEGVALRNTLVTPPVRRAEPADTAVAVPAKARAEAVLARGPQPDATVRATTLLDLVIAGATSNRAGLLVAALLGGDYFLDIMPTDWLLRRFLPPQFAAPETAAQALVQTAQHDLRTFLVGLVVLTLFFGLAGWGLSVLASVVRFFDFRLSRIGADLRVSYGLFTRRERGFRRSRVQNVQIEESILRRWLGFAALRVQTAGYGPGVKADERVETLTPIARSSEIADYLTAVFPDIDWECVGWRASHPRARRRLFIRRALLVLLASALLAALVDVRALASLAALVPAWLLAAAHYRQLGHARSGSYVLMREGFWTRRTHVVPLRKIQALHLSQSPFQRRLGLGTLLVETAGNPYDRHPPRCVDLGSEYGRDLMENLASQVARTGIVF